MEQLLYLAALFGGGILVYKVLVQAAKEAFRAFVAWIMPYLVMIVTPPAILGMIWAILSLRYPWMDNSDKSFVLFLIVLLFALITYIVITNRKANGGGDDKKK